MSGGRWVGYCVSSPASAALVCKETPTTLRATCAGDSVLVKTSGDLAAELRTAGDYSSAPARLCPHGLCRVTGHQTLADILYPSMFCHSPPDWQTVTSPPTLDPCPERMAALIAADAAERCVKLDDLTPAGGIDYASPMPPDTGCLDFAMRTLQIHARLHQADSALPHTCAVPIVPLQSVLDTVFSLHDEIGAFGCLSLPPRLPWEFSGDHMLDCLASIVDTASAPLSDGEWFSGRGARPGRPGSFQVSITRDLPGPRPRPFTMIPEIADVVGEYVETPLRLPSLALPSVLTDVGFNRLTLPTPLHPGELVVAYHYLQSELFAGLDVREFDDQMAKAPSSSCGVGFAANLHQSDVSLSAAQAKFLVGKNIPNAINCIPKYVPGSDSRTRVVCGVNILATAAMKSLMKPVQEAIVRRTQSTTPGVSAVGLAKNDAALNRYFTGRLADFPFGPETLVFSADHTKCDRTVASHHVGTAYAYLVANSGGTVDRALVDWMLRTCVECPMVYRGVRVDGRMCEASGDAATCHTNTIFNVHVHIAVFMRTVVSDERYPPELRHAVYQAYMGDYTHVDTILRVLTQDMRFVMFSDDGLVFHTDAWSGVWNPENWSMKLQSISGLRVDRSKSAAAPLAVGVEFLGGHLKWAPGEVDGKPFGPLVLAPTATRLAKQLLLVKHGSMWSAIERVGGILLSAACMVFTQRDELRAFYDACHEWAVGVCNRLGVDLPCEFPSWSALVDVAFGVYVEPQTATSCVCGSKAFTVCRECVVDAPLCIYHAGQHFETSTHRFNNGTCSCGEARFDRLGFAGPFVRCAACADPTTFVPFSAMATILPPESGVDTSGSLVDWVLTDPYWRAVQTSCRIAMSQAEIFHRDVGNRVSPTSTLKPGTRFKVKQGSQWHAAVVDHTGQVITKAGPITSSCLVMPLSAEMGISPTAYRGLSSATYIQGPPGTGKTTCAVRLICENRHRRVMYTAPSNAAVAEMVAKLNEAGIRPQWVVPKLSSYDYPHERLSPSSMVKVATTGCVSERVDLLIIDECSLLSPAEVCKLAAVGRECVLLGDHLQLSPVTNPPMPWGSDFWLLGLVREHRVLDQSYRFGADVVSLIHHIYPTLRPAAHDTSVSVHSIAVARSRPSGQDLVMYNHDLQRFPDALTVDSAQGSTFDEVNLLVTSDTPFTRREARVNVGCTRARRALRVYAPASWVSAMCEQGFVFPPLVAEQVSPTFLGSACVYADFEFSHTLAAGATKHKNLICEYGVYDPVTGKEYGAYLPARDPETGCKPAKVVIPSVCKHARGHDHDESYRPAVSAMWKALLLRPTVVLWNGAADRIVLGQMRQSWCTDGPCAECRAPASVWIMWRSAPLRLCRACYSVDARRTDLRYLVNYATLNFCDLSGPRLSVAHASVCGHLHGEPHHALSDALATACVHAHREGFGRASPPQAPRGFSAVPLATGPWSIRGLVVVDGACALPAVLPVIPSEHGEAAAIPCKLTVVACPLSATSGPCGRCCQLQRRADGFSQKYPGWTLVPQVQLQTAYSTSVVTGFVVEGGREFVTLSVSPYRYPYIRSIPATLASLAASIQKPLPVRSVVRGLSLWGSTVAHSDLPLVPVEAAGVLTTNPAATDGVVVSWSRLDAESLPAYGARFEVACVEGASAAHDDIPYWLTSRVGGVSQPLTSYFSIGALTGVCDLSNYADVEPPPQYAHIFSGEAREGSVRVDGVHHPSGPIQRATIRCSLDGTVADCSLAGVAKARTTLIDVSRAAFCKLIQEAEASFTTQSKVVTTLVDFHPIRFMVWKGRTTYPVQAQMLEIPPKHTASRREPFPEPLTDSAAYALGVDVARMVCAVLPRPRGGPLHVRCTGLPLAFLEAFLADSGALLDGDGDPPSHLFITTQGPEPAVVDFDLITPGGYLLVMDDCSGPLARFTTHFGSWTRFYSPVQGVTTWTWFLFSGRMLSPRPEPTDSDYALQACWPWRESVTSLAVPRRPAQQRCVPTIPSSALSYDFDRISDLAARGKLYVS